MLHLLGFQGARTVCVCVCVCVCSCCTLRLSVSRSEVELSLELNSDTGSFLITRFTEDGLYFYATSLLISERYSFLFSFSLN